MNVFQRPSKRDYRSFRTWFWNETPLASEREEEFIKRKEDLISLRNGREWGGFDGFVEDVIRKFHCPFIHVSYPLISLHSCTISYTFLRCLTTH
jgi:hypothetical protein